MSTETLTTPRHCFSSTHKQSLALTHTLLTSRNKSYMSDRDLSIILLCVCDGGLDQDCSLNFTALIEQKEAEQFHECPVSGKAEKATSGWGSK